MGIQLNGITGDITTPGDVGIGGTLTYEDVANIDSVGVVTARSGIKIGPTAGVAGTFFADGSYVTAGIITAATFHGDGSNLTGIDATQIVTGNTSVQTVDTGSDGHVKINTEGTERLRIFSDGKFGFGTNSLSETTMAEFSSSTGSGAIGSNITIRNSSTDSVNNIAELRLKTAHGVARIFKYNTSETVFMSHHGGASDLIMQADGASNFRVKTNASERLRITSAGNIGVGEADPSPFGGEYRGLDVAYKGSGISGRTGNPTFTMRSNIYYDGSNWKYGEGSTTAGVLSIGGSQLVFESAASGTAGATATITEKFRIDSSGHVLPGANNTYDLGSTSKRWRNVYTNDLNLSNEGSQNDVDGTWGDYTIQEGESDLFLINKRSGKKFKFMLQEVN